MLNEKTGVIYKLTSPNGKIYIGQTINFKKRFRKYKCGAFNGQIKLWNNCQKYNWNPIDYVYIIETCLIDELDDREIYWIDKYDSYLNGLNCNLGGKTRKGFKHSEETKEKLRGYKHTDESKEKIRLVNIGRIVSEETKEKLRLSNTGRKHSEETINKIKETKKNNPYRMTEEDRLKVSIANIGNTKMLGKNHSDETKLKISETKKGISNLHLSIKIICVNSGVIYESQVDAANELGLRQASISRVCTKVRKTYKGLVFMFYDEYLKINNEENEKKNNGI